MQVGIFVLTKTIANPKPDRRMRDKWLAAPEWKEGSRFALRRAWWQERGEKDTPASNKPKSECYELEFLGERYSEKVAIIKRDGTTRVRTVLEEQEPAMLDLLDSLRLSLELDDRLKWVFLEHGDRINDHATDIVFRLVHQSVLTVDQVRKAYQERNAEYDAEEAAKAEAAKTPPVNA